MPQSRPPFWELWIGAYVWSLLWRIAGEEEPVCPEIPGWLQFSCSLRNKWPTDPWCLKPALLPQGTDSSTVLLQSRAYGAPGHEESFPEAIFFLVPSSPHPTSFPLTEFFWKTLLSKSHTLKSLSWALWTEELWLWESSWFVLRTRLRLEIWIRYWPFP